MDPAALVPSVLLHAGASCVSVSALVRIRERSHGCQHTLSFMETHVDVHVQRDTADFCLHVVRNNEDLLKPHCRYMQMSGMN